MTLNLIDGNTSITRSRSTAKLRLFENFAKDDGVLVQVFGHIRFSPPTADQRVPDDGMTIDDMCRANLREMLAKVPVHIPFLRTLEFQSTSLFDPQRRKTRMMRDQFIHTTVRYQPVFLRNSDELYAAYRRIEREAMQLYNHLWDLKWSLDSKIRFHFPEGQHHIPQNMEQMLNRCNYMNIKVTSGSEDYRSVFKRSI